MREVTLKPIYDYDKYHQHILQVLEFELYYDIFRPLFDIIGFKMGKGPVAPEGETEIRFGSRWNKVGSAVEQALMSGRITYLDGYFYGVFNALIARELRALGASFDKRKKAYRLVLRDVPTGLKTVITTSRQRVEEEARVMQDKIDQIAKKALQIDLAKYVSNVFDNLDTQFVRTVKPSLEVPMEMSAGMRNQIQEDYINNVDTYINGWKQEQVVRLREAVQENAAQGFRADHMAKILESEYGITRNKAKFIARQETGLLVSKYRETRYTEAGIEQYQWSTSGDERVRRDHRDLNGKKFSWSSPPVVDKATGRRGNPGEDFNCLPCESNIDFAYGIKKCFRRWYAGNLTEVITAQGKTIRATPNHQVLTLSGWKAISMLNDSDYLVDLSDELIKSRKNNIYNSKTIIGEIFEALSINLPVLSGHRFGENFNSNVADGKINIIRATRSLCFYVKSRTLEFINNLCFAFANTFTLPKSNKFQSSFSMDYGISSSYGGNSFSFFNRSVLESQDVGFRSTTNMNTGIKQSLADNNSFQSGSVRDSEFALSRKIGLNDRSRVKFNKVMRFFTFPSIGFNSHFSQMFRKIIRIKADNLGSFIQRNSLIQQFDRVVKVTTHNFSGHIYNIHTVNNWYCTNGIVVHNCRCLAIPIIRLSEENVK